MTHAILLTDVVDSTRLTEELGDERMSRIWVAHDRAVRDLLPAWRGREADRTDGFLLLFTTVADAAAFALQVHEAMAAIGERFGVGFAARVGIHWGPVVLIETSETDRARGAKPLEVEGIAKPTAARVMSVATGGQTLLSEDARAALGPTALRLESHGHWRMKGVAEPVELFEVGKQDAPFTPPPDAAKVYRVVRDGELWLPVKQVKHSLLRERDAFVGRQADLQELARRLDDGAALISVLGIGGTGKTRLVTHYGWTWLGDWPGGVWFCDLSEARDVDGIAFAVARAMGVPLGTDDPVVRLGHAIAGRGRCLVILDNFEQVARHAEETLGRWLDRVSEAAFVVTTREVLGLPGEQALALAPLPGADGVALFVARATAAKRDFTLTDADRPHVESLVRLLDGLPLAIELAAARVRVMSPKALLARMSERFKLLASTGGRHIRQVTLRGALDWSWDLLSSNEQSALAQLAVFEGGFALEAAEVVLALEELWPMDALQALVDKSLVRQVSDDSFDLLVSVQEYAAEKLDALGGRLEAEVRHAGHYAAHGAPDALASLSSHGGVAALRALGRELDNLVAACRRSVTRGAAEPAVALLQAAWEVLQMTGPVALAVDLAQGVAAISSLSPVAKGASHRVRGEALRLAGRTEEARVHFDAALAVAREVGDRRLEGVVLRNLGFLHFEQGRPDEARAHLEAALAVAREVEDCRFESFVLNNLGKLHWQQGRLDEARTLYDAALAMAREVGDRRFEVMVLNNLGNLHSGQGRLAEAHAHYDAALGIAREIGFRREEGVVLNNLGIQHREQGGVDEARDHYEAALAVHREVGNRGGEGRVLGNLGLLHQEQGRLDEARAHYEQALTVHREVGNRRAESLWLGNLGVLHAQQGRTDEAGSHYEQALAVAREVGDGRSESLWLGNLGDLHAQQGRMDKARAQYEQALAVARAVRDRRLEGIGLGNLGALHLDQGRLDEARASFEAGETLLREIRDLLQLGRVLCGRARLDQVVGNPEAARAALAEAEALALEVGAGPESELGLELAKARAALKGP